MGMSLLLNQFCTSPRGNVEVSNNQYFIKRRIDNILYCEGGGNSSVSVEKNHGSLMRATRKTKPVKGVVSCSNAQPSSAEEPHGIGIVEFFRGTKLLITGATGFLAKVLVEKILRTMPDVDKIFVLIRAKNEAAAMERLQHEIIDAEVFRCLQQKHGKSYQTFMLTKLVPVVGNLCESNLGMDEDLVDVIANQVDVIVHSAANTTFDERYDVALNINTRGPCQMMSFARKCKKLKLFLHFSTAYVNGERQGQVMEMPFRMGDCIARERLNTSGTPQRSIPVLDVEGEMKWALDLEETSQDNEVAQKFRKLGMKRAKMYGWQDTYAFTKAMGEMVVDNERGQVPVVIIRPGIVESSYREPFAGWMEGNRLMDPLITLYAKGHISGFLMNPNVVLDVVPVDMVVNATLAAIAKHGAVENPELNVYQIVSSIVNPLVIKDLCQMCYEHFSSSPWSDSNGRQISVSKFRHFTSMEEFSSHLREMAIRRTRPMPMANSSRITPQRMESVYRKSVELGVHLANIYKGYTFYAGRFDCSNVQRLMDCMSGEEKKEFGFDVRSISWKDYIKDIHIPGLRRNVMKDRAAK